MKKKLLMLLLATTSYHAHSAGNWYGPYTISSVGKVMAGKTHKVVITVNKPVNTGCAINDSTKTMKYASGGRHLLPSAVSLRTQRATFTALGSSLYKGIK
ncbi:hypothetical protein ACMAZD_05755 [Vibrio sp. nBUS_14]|uniref:hypothetical protein n=1 Tax=Vibrio sp. nBUS_14 TaxID=3395321 RepID=UPI003EB88623